MQLDDYTVPKGIVFFDPFDANGNLTGEIDLGNTPGANLSVETTNLEHFSSRGGLNEKDRDIPLSISRNFALTIDNISFENLAYFIIGDVADLVQSNTPVVDEAITVQQGRWYQLGSGITATGVRNTTSVVIQDDTDTTTYTLTTDYLVDEALGRIFIVEGGTIADDDVLHVDYTPATETRKRVTAASTPISGAMRVVADNPEGTNKDAYFPSVSLKPSGELPLIAAEDSWASMGMDVGINKKTASTPAAYFDGRAVG